MKYKILTIIFLCIVKILTAQETIKVETVQDTFTPPQYIGEYDYLFMRHEPKKRLWKVSYPMVSFSYFRLAYEQRLAKLSTAFSINFESRLLYGYFNNKQYGASNQIGFNLGTELRWYSFMEKRIAKGKSANNMNGWFLGFLSEYEFNSTNSYSLTRDFKGDIIEAKPYNKLSHNFYFGPTLGYQQRLSRNLYYGFKVGALKGVKGSDDWKEPPIRIKLGFAF
jgi:hypothetical protein